MVEEEKQLLQNIFSAQVLLLAGQLKADKKAKGVTSTSDFVNDAVRLILREKQRILLIR